jgi:hypothetical protein
MENLDLLTISRIGDISKGIDGRDEYVLLTCLDDAIDFESVYLWLLQRVYRETNTPGGYFCHDVTIVPMPYADNKCIGIIHHRFDV